MEYITIYAYNMDTFNIKIKEAGINGYTISPVQPKYRYNNDYTIVTMERKNKNNKVEI